MTVSKISQILLLSLPEKKLRRWAWFILDPIKV